MEQVNGYKFRRQHPCGGYILDSAGIALKLAVEVDGGQHDENKEKDAKRTTVLESEGWTVLRFWNHEVLKEVDVVLSVIETRCHPHPNLPPEHGKR